MASPLALARKFPLKLSYESFRKFQQTIFHDERYEIFWFLSQDPLGMKTKTIVWDYSLGYDAVGNLLPDKETHKAKKVVCKLCGKKRACICYPNAPT